MPAWFRLLLLFTLLLCYGRFRRRSWRQGYHLSCRPSFREATFLSLDLRDSPGSVAPVERNGIEGGISAETGGQPFDIGEEQPSRRHRSAQHAKTSRTQARNAAVA